jgi:hypothetical protein
MFFPFPAGLVIFVSGLYISWFRKRTDHIPVKAQRSFLILPPAILLMIMSLVPSLLVFFFFSALSKEFRRMLDHVSSYYAAWCFVLAGSFMNTCGGGIELQAVV